MIATQAQSDPRADRAVARVGIARTLSELTAAPTIVAIGLALLAWWPVTSGYGRPAAVATAAGCLIALLGSWASAAPLVLTMRAAPVVFASGALASLGVRFAVTIGLALACWASQALPGDPLMISVGVSQLALLAVDVGMQIRLARRVLGGQA